MLAFLLQGGGIFVDSGANLDGCQVNENLASYVRSHYEPSQTFPPAPRWNVTRAHGWQRGGGLAIFGTATLTNTNVYQNEAGDVCSPLNIP